MIEFSVPGAPQQQGSKSINAHGAMYDSNTDLERWRGEVAMIARNAYRSGKPITQGVGVWVRFVFDRPKAHYGTGRNAGKLKPSAAYWYASAPDADKLQRALGDALTQSKVIEDDRLIVGWNSMKVYGARPMTHVKIVIPDSREWDKLIGGS